MGVSMSMRKPIEIACKPWPSIGSSDLPTFDSDLAAKRLVLALARIAELDVQRDVVAGDLDVARRARAEEVIAGIRVDELVEDALNVRVTERHLQSVSQNCPFPEQSRLTHMASR